MSQSFPKYLRCLACMIGGILMIVAALNLIADPYQCFRCFNITSLRQSAVGYGTRTGKGEMIAGHDWGAPVAWHAALLRPDRFRAVVGLSVPYRPRGGVAPTTVMPQNADASFYQLYFQQPGIAEAELEADPRVSISKILYSGSGDVPRRNPGGSGQPVGMVPRTGGWLSRIF